MATAWTARAFGLELVGDFEAPGLPPTPTAAGRPHTQLRLVDAGAFAAAWDPAGAERVNEWRYPDGRAFFTIDHHPALGYRIAARRYGRFIVSAGGDEVLCAPYKVSAWSWQRLLIARVLPIAATLRGIEVLHSSAVRIGDGAVAISGPSGLGKSSLAMQLYYRHGAAFLTDDLLGLEAPEGGVVAHPGFAIVSLRPAERELLSREEKARLGAVVSRGNKTHFALEREPGPLPLRAMFFLEPGEVGAPTIERMEEPDPLLLLASTFVLMVRTPERLRRQLDVCAAIADDVPLYRLRIAPSLNARATAEIVHEHIRALDHAKAA
ncbi:MAG: hypothetical protein QOK49_1296 [Baekduia sp.]|nr:hypothetical protein [Baekduia sp.]